MTTPTPDSTAIRDAVEVALRVHTDGHRGFIAALRGSSSSAEAIAEVLAVALVFLLKAANVDIPTALDHAFRTVAATAEQAWRATETDRGGSA